jgi:hypothetical protein
MKRLLNNRFKMIVLCIIIQIGQSNWVNGQCETDLKKIIQLTINRDSLNSFYDRLDSTQNLYIYSQFEGASDSSKIQYVENMKWAPCFLDYFGKTEQRLQLKKFGKKVLFGNPMLLLAFYKIPAMLCISGVKIGDSEAEVRFVTMHLDQKADRMAGLLIFTRQGSNWELSSEEYCQFAPTEINCELTTK